MVKTILDILKEKGALSADKIPMKPKECDLSRGEPIIDIPRRTGCGPDLMIYDNVTTPDGRTLIQGSGRVYHSIVRGEELSFEVQKVDGSLPFGVVGVYKNDYYLANRQFVDSLKT